MPNDPLARFRVSRSDQRSSAPCTDRLKGIRIVKGSLSGLVLAIESVEPSRSAMADSGPPGHGNRSESRGGPHDATRESSPWPGIRDRLPRSVAVG